MGHHNMLNSATETPISHFSNCHLLRPTFDAQGAGAPTTTLTTCVLTALVCSTPTVL